MRNFSKRVVWGDRKLNLNVCHRERGASGFMFRNHSLQRCNLLIGERERDIFTPVFTRQEDVKPVKGFEQLQVQAASQSGKHSSVLAHFFK